MTPDHNEQPAPPSAPSPAPAADLPMWQQGLVVTAAAVAILVGLGATCGLVVAAFRCGAGL